MWPNGKRETRTSENAGGKLVKKMDLYVVFKHALDCLAVILYVLIIQTFIANDFFYSYVEKTF